MILEQLPDIPRLYTGIAEWGACAVYILLLWNTHARRRRTSAALLLGLPFLIGVQILAGMAPLSLWLAGMIASACAMALLIWVATGVRATVLWHLVARAFVLAELTASLSWQIIVWFTDDPFPGQPLSFLGTLGIYGFVLLLVHFLERRHFPRGEDLHLDTSDLLSAATIAVITFAMSNLSFLTVTTPFSGRLGTEVFYIRTLVDLCGFVVLYAQQERLREIAVASELASMEATLQAQHNLYLQAKAEGEAISRARHDLKHQITLIRAEVDSERAQEHLAELERSVGAMARQYHSGNPILDVILTSKAQACAAQDITLTVVADGTLLGSMGSMDLATLFGNALDNAIEACARVPAPDRRLIKLALHNQGSMVVLRVENWFESPLSRDSHGDLRSTKRDSTGHGLGVKSIRWTARKYGGEVTTTVDGNWFTLTVLLPSTSPSTSTGASNHPTP